MLKSPEQYGTDKSLAALLYPDGIRHQIYLFGLDLLNSSLQNMLTGGHKSISVFSSCSSLLEMFLPSLTSFADVIFA